MDPVVDAGTASGESTGGARTVVTTTVKATPEDVAADGFGAAMGPGGNWEWKIMTS